MSLQISRSKQNEKVGQKLDSGNNYLGTQSVQKYIIMFIFDFSETINFPKRSPCG